jgi:hypothetical protein
MASDKLGDMDRKLHSFEVDQNYDAFQRALASILSDHRHQFALMRDRVIVGYFDKPGDAYREGVLRYSDELFSIQEVTDEPIDLGFYSHVGH